MTKQRPTREENCAKHGRYVSTFFEADSELSISKDTWTECFDCYKEKREEERKVEERRERIAALRRWANIPARFANKALESFQTESKEQQQALALARNYVANFARYRREGRCLVFSGDYGTGKTHLACSILEGVIEQGCHVRFATVMEVIRSIRETWQPRSQKSENEVLREWIDVDLLVIDDIGVQHGSEAERTHLFDVIDGRYRAKRPTIITTNLDMKGLLRYLGERVVDRLQEDGGRVLLFTGESWRARVPQEASERRAEGNVQ